MTAPTLRPYQREIVDAVYSDWRGGALNVLVVSPTGSGKTVIMGEIISSHQGASVAIAHRQELVGQISLSLGSFGVKHRIIAPKSVVSTIIGEHRLAFGRSFFDPSAPAAVAGVDTLKSRAVQLEAWCRQVGLWVCDEAHHNLRANKWGAANDMFPNAIGLGVTATPQRADGRGLGAHADGVFHSMILGPSQRELIDQGALTDYQIVAPPGDFDVEAISITAKGDFSPKGMREASRESHIVGDVVDHYLKFAAGKKGITFATDVETAQYMAQQYRDAGVRAEAVSAKTPEHVRNEFVRRFRNGGLDQLVNVDLFGEGFDLPALEVVSMARPTQSLAVYMQQFGRALRPLPGKSHALIIDHVGNVKRHNLPDIPRRWTLDRRDKRAKKTPDPEVIALTTCLECFKVYERTERACPHCGHLPKPEGRTKPEQVDGDLELLSTDVLDKMRAAVLSIDEPASKVEDRVAYVAGPLAGRGAANRHVEKQEAQAELRNAIAVWAGAQRAKGRDDVDSYRRFFLTYGIDVLSAQALPRADADKLRMEIER